MSKWIVDIHGDIEGDYEIIEEYKEPKTDVLDEIKAEIKQLPFQRIFGNVSSYSLLDTVVEIIDKYREEQ